MKSTKVSVIIPCRNEQESIGACVREIKEVFAAHGLDGEIIVSDSSTDESPEIALREGAKVIKHDKEGYGVAIREGVNYAAGDVLVYGDGDGTYRFTAIPQLLNVLNHADIALGSRRKGTIEKGAMPFLHRFIGTPVLNMLLFVFFGLHISDSQSGLRALRRKTFLDLKLKTTGMEFATEMLIKAKKNNLKIKEIPISYFRRKGISKLRRYRDGFAHIKYILMQTPLALYFAIGGIFLIIGIIGLLFGKSLNYFLNSATVKILFPFLGIQILFLGLFAKTYLYTRFDEKVEFIKKFYSVFKLKTAISFGFLLIAIPILFKLAGTSVEFFDPLFVSTIVGLQVISNSFILSTLSIKSTK